MSNTIKGTVKWFDEQKGIGFITPEDGSKDVFVQQSGIIDPDFPSLTEGERVEFVIEHGPNGPTAASVKKI